MKKRIVITGSRGLIGSTLTRYFKEKSSCEIFELSRSLGHDLTDEGFVKEWFKANQADYLVNLFAFNDPMKASSSSDRGTLFDISLDSFRQYMEVNVISLFSVCREFARNASAKGIINFSSIYGVVSPLPHMYGGKEKHIAYSASKGAVIHLTRHLAVHLAPEVRANCIILGGIEDNTQGADFIKAYGNHTPMGRMMRVEEINKLIDHLCSEDSSYMTGSALTVDGGWTAW